MNQFLVSLSILISMAIWFSPATAQAEGLPIFRISVENTATHVQTKAVKRFADLLAFRLRNVLDVQFYDKAQLFRGRDVIDALSKGRVEMAVPGTWHVSRFDPNVSLFLLPMFLGAPAETTYAIGKSEVGTILAQSIERTTGCVVLGTWIDLGFAHLYGVGTPVNGYEDIKGKLVRVAGGKANELRIAALGGKPASIPWPDLPQRLEQKSVDALLTTHETVVSARLWQYGVSYVFEDFEYFPQYIPLVNGRFWNRLSDETKAIFLKTWEEVAAGAREEAKEAQQRARKVLVENGVSFVTPGKAYIALWRKRAMKQQDQIIRTIGIDPDIVAIARKIVGGE